MMIEDLGVLVLPADEVIAVLGGIPQDGDAEMNGEQGEDGLIMAVVPEALIDDGEDRVGGIRDDGEVFAAAFEGVEEFQGEGSPAEADVGGVDLVAEDVDRLVQAHQLEAV